MMIDHCTMGYHILQTRPSVLAMLTRMYMWRLLIVLPTKTKQTKAKVCTKVGGLNTRSKGFPYSMIVALLKPVPSCKKARRPTPLWSLIHSVKEVMIDGKALLIAVHPAGILLKALRSWPFQRFEVPHRRPKGYVRGPNKNMVLWYTTSSWYVYIYIYIHIYIYIYIYLEWPLIQAWPV